MEPTSLGRRDPAAEQPEKVGPYRLEQRLGAGGMGAVCRAWDERLKRPVAIKRILPEAKSHPAARARFRREAEAVAQLNHPAIVHVYDILEIEDDDWLVMELVEGRTLQALLREGPIDPLRAVRLARQIAEGLADAHVRGIIHRDLKASNVMVTPSGYAKILDFGVAKQILPEAQETTLSSPGTIIGTSYAMSPEQAMGLPLDARSDLFSLGSLLYEMVTGVAPFRAETASATLARVCSFRQHPAWILHPGLSRELSDLIDRLLEKNPADRPRNAVETAEALDKIALSLQEGSTPGPPDHAASLATLSNTLATEIPTVFEAPISPRASGLDRAAALSKRWSLRAGAAFAVLLVGLAASFLVLRPPQKVSSVAVLKPRLGAMNSAQEPEILASAVRMALLRGVLLFEGLAPIPLDQVDSVGGTSAEAARALAADQVVTSSLECAKLTCQVSLSRFSSAQNSIVWAYSFEVPASDFLSLASSVMANLRGGFQDFQPRKGTPTLEVQPEDYREYLRILQSFLARQDKVRPATVLERLQGIHQTSPRFLEAWLLESRAAHQIFLNSRDSGDLERAFAAIRKARELSPRDPQAIDLSFVFSLDGNRLEQAEEAIRTREEISPGDPMNLAMRAQLLDKSGRTEEAIGLMTKATQRQPSVRNLFNLANLEYRAGQIMAARKHLESVLNISPGHFNTLSFLAQLELLDGSSQRAIELYQNLVRLSPGMTEISNLGLAYLLDQRYEQAAERFRQALALAPKAPFAVLNLADAELLRGRNSESRKLYVQLLEMIDPSVAKDDWQSLTMRAQALAHLGRNREAAAAVQDALRLAPDHPQAAYEVAVVYALVGDRTSALLNAQRALDLGFHPRWFAFPWFTPLRPELEALVQKKSAAER